MFYHDNAEELRNFFKDKVGLPCTDIGGGWLIFKFDDADMGVHPSGGRESPGEPHGTHDISFYCDNIHDTVDGMKQRGVEFVNEIEDHGYGFVVLFKAPGDLTLQLYQPKYDK